MFQGCFFDKETVDSATQNLLTICKNAVEQSEETDGEQTMKLQLMVIEDSMESQNNNNSCSNKKALVFKYDWGIWWKAEPVYQ